MKTKVYITGAAGFVGRNLIPVLLKNDNEIIAFVKNESEKKAIADFNVKTVVADLSNPGKWQNVFFKNSIIVHLASEISSKTAEAFTKNNVTATQNLINAAKKSKVKKIIHFSSAAVTSIRLDDYARTKKIQEETVIKSKIPYLVLRPSMMYGPTDDKNIGWLINMTKKLPIIPLPGGGNFGRQPVFIQDICLIVSKLINTKAGNKIYEIHGYEYITLRQMISSIKQQLKMKKVMLPVPVVFLKTAVFVQGILLKNPKFTTDQIDSLTSGEKFHGDDWARLFDIIPTKFSHGLRKMIN